MIARKVTFRPPGRHGSQFDVGRQHDHAARGACGRTRRPVRRRWRRNAHILKPAQPLRLRIARRCQPREVRGLGRCAGSAGRAPSRSRSTSPTSTSPAEAEAGADRVDLRHQRRHLQAVRRVVARRAHDLHVEHDHALVAPAWLCSVAHRGRHEVGVMTKEHRGAGHARHAACSNRSNSQRSAPHGPRARRAA